MGSGTNTPSVAMSPASTSSPERICFAQVTDGGEGQTGDTQEDGQQSLSQDCDETVSAAAVSHSCNKPAAVSQLTKLPPLPALSVVNENRQNQTKDGETNLDETSAVSGRGRAACHNGSAASRVNAVLTSPRSPRTPRKGPRGVAQQPRAGPLVKALTTPRGVENPTPRSQSGASDADSLRTVQSETYIGSPGSSTEEDGARTFSPSWYICD